MRKLQKQLAVITLVFCGLQAFAQRPIPQEKWKATKSKNSSFTVLLPGKVKEAVDKGKDGTTVKLSTEVAGTAYIAADTAFAQSIGTREDADRILDGSEGGIVKKMKAVLATKENTVVNGMPARHIRYTFQSEGVDMAGESLLVFTGGHLYHIMMLAGSPGPDQKDAERYFNSLTLNGVKFTDPES